MDKLRPVVDKGLGLERLPLGPESFNPTVIIKRAKTYVARHESTLEWENDTPEEREVRKGRNQLFVRVSKG